MKRVPLKSKIVQRIQRSPRRVFLRGDFEKLGGYDQVGRALRQLEKEGQLIRIGYGLYARARLNRITGKPMLDADQGFDEIAKEALDRLEVDWSPSDAEDAYLQGSPQIPVNSAVKINGRFNRKIETDKFKLRILQG